MLQVSDHLQRLSWHDQWTQKFHLCLKGKIENFLNFGNVTDSQTDSDTWKTTMQYAPLGLRRYSIVDSVTSEHSPP